MFKSLKRIFSLQPAEAARQKAAPLESHVSSEAGKDEIAQGNACLGAGKLEEAAYWYEKAIEANPGNAAAHVNLGYVLSELRRYQEAANCLRKAIDQAPKNGDALYLLGTVSQQLGQIQDAMRYLEQALTVQPGLEMAYAELSQLLLQSGRVHEAVQVLEKSVGYCISADLHAQLGSLYFSLKRYGEAGDLFSKALTIAPSQVQLHFGFGNALQMQGRLQEAATAYQKAIHLQPDDVAIHSNLCVALLGLGRKNEALQCCEKILTLAPNHVDAWINRSALLREMHCYEEALASADCAVQLKPDSAEALTNRAGALQALNRHAEALASYECALQLAPNDAIAHLGEAHARLVIGDYARGWEEFEWRWATGADGPKNRSFKQPLWLGRESLQGKTILLHAEQGFGDTIQFCRYAKLVAGLGATVLLEVQRGGGLKSLLYGLEGVSQILENEPLPHFDFQTPLMSLPLAFKTMLETIPAQPDYIQCELRQAEKWRMKLGEKRQLRVGLVWSGGLHYKNDHNRSAPLAVFSQVFSNEVEFISLHKEVRESDKAALENSPILHFGDELKDFTETAGLVANMDLVISVDTSVAHLAGAMGKPVWVLLPFSPDFRWLLDREDSPWYPTARLFRQPAIGDWDSVMARLVQELKELSRPAGLSSVS